MRRVPEFDALRALAAAGVLLFHIQNQPGTWTHFGFTGVHLFLILSGYLITGIILRHGGSPGFLRAFYARRILRIWPIYYLTLVALVLYQRYVYTNPPSLSGLPYFATFTQYLYSWPGLSGVLPHPRGTTVHAFEHSWTLAIEEQFYLLWPLAILLLGKRMILPMIAAVVGFGFWYKTLPDLDHYLSWTLPYVAGAFALGALIAVLLRNPAQVQRCRGLLSLGFLACSLAGLGFLHVYYNVHPGGKPPWWSETYIGYWHATQNYAFYLLHFGIVGFVATNAGAWFLAPLRIREVTYLGEISYGLYLYHLPIYWAMNKFGIHDASNDPWTVWVSKLTLTFVVATLSYRYIEMPILGLKRFFPYGDEPTAVDEKAQDAPPAAIRQPKMVYARPGSLGGEKAGSARANDRPAQPKARVKG